VPHDNLPLLPLTSGVLLPGMVFTMALESEEAVAAVEAAEAADGSLVIVPFIEGRYASVGVVAEVAERGELPGGMAAVAVRGVERARLGTAVPGTGRALWVEVDRVADGHPDDPAVAVELAREYRAVVENILVSRGPADWPSGSPTRPTPVAWPTWPATPPTSPSTSWWPCSRRSTSWTGCAWSWGGPARSWPISPCASASRRTSRRAWRRPSASSCSGASSRPSARSWR